MNPARLAELERQRALVRAHLLWLEKEITNESNIAGPVASFVPAVPVAAPIDDAYEFQPDPVSAAASARRGCLLYAFLVLLIGALALVAVYFARYRGRPFLFVDEQVPAAKKVSAPHPAVAPTSK